MAHALENAKQSLEATPTLVIDEGTVQRNLQKLHEYAVVHKLAVRPHTKTHKSGLLAKRQLAAGSCGLTVAKVGEAEVMAEVCDDILIAYPAVDPVRARRIADLSHRCRIRVAVDSVWGVKNLATAAREAGTTIGVLVDLDVGFHRTGVATPDETLHLARIVQANEGPLHLDGLFFYPGHVPGPSGLQRQVILAVDQLLGEAVGLWQDAGLRAPVVSGGSTPSLYQSHRLTHQTEIRPGTYIFNDMNTVKAGACTLAECAAGVVASVVSTSVAGKAVIDAGTKTLTSDRNGPEPESGFGQVLEYPAARITRLSEEHGEIDFTHSPVRAELGERVTILPNHICPCINLQDAVWLQSENGGFVMLPVDARGKLI